MYYKSKIELNLKKTNLSDAVRFSTAFFIFFALLKSDFRYSNLSFFRLSLGRVTDKLELELKFLFTIRL